MSHDQTGGREASWIHSRTSPVSSITSSSNPASLHSLASWIHLSFFILQGHLMPIILQLRRPGLGHEGLSISSGRCSALDSAFLNGVLYQAAFSYIIKQQL